MSKLEEKLFFSPGPPPLDMTKQSLKLMYTTKEKIRLLDAIDSPNIFIIKVTKYLYG